MDLKPGSRWKSAVCSAEAVVVRPPSGPVTLQCGGLPMVAHTEDRPEGLVPAAGHATGSLLGKRYVDDATGLEALCSKAGLGSFSVDGRPLRTKEAKKLPSSD
jgi:hypothetical protein